MTREGFEKNARKGRIGDDKHLGGHFKEGKGKDTDPKKKRGIKNPIEKDMGTVELRIPKTETFDRTTPMVRPEHRATQPFKIPKVSSKSNASQKTGSSSWDAVQQATDNASSWEEKEKIANERKSEPAEKPYVSDADASKETQIMGAVEPIKRMSTEEVLQTVPTPYEDPAEQK